VPDHVVLGTMPLQSIHPADAGLEGIPASVGSAEGPVCLVRSPQDFGKVKRGDILVVPVIDPGMAPLFAVAAGLVAEMGGTLSHGAIMVREYGLPAIVNVQGITRLVADGDRIAVNAETGTVTRLE
jgi:pyruvate,water dikinase